MAGPAEVLDFWFGAPDSPERGRARKAWFIKSDAFDQAIRERFAATALAARRGELDHWSDTPLAGLALLILLDQFPRNLHRGSADAFASDARALSVARAMLARGFDRVLRPVERLFVYLPFEHSEDLAVQRTSLALFEARWRATGRTMSTTRAAITNSSFVSAAFRTAMRRWAECPRRRNSPSLRTPARRSEHRPSRHGVVRVIREIQHGP